MTLQQQIDKIKEQTEEILETIILLKKDFKELRNQFNDHEVDSAFEEIKKSIEGSNEEKD